MICRDNQRRTLKTATLLIMSCMIGAIASVGLPMKAESVQNHAKLHRMAEYFLKQERSELSQEWRLSTRVEEYEQWTYILNSPMGIAALNQLAIEGFISPVCPKTFYLNEQYGGFQFLMQVECPEPRGTSIAVGYDEVHVIFNRFEDNIEGFEIQRFGQF